VSTELVIPIANALRPRSSRDTCQVYGTPVEFLRAVKERFGKIGWDLAASAENNVAPEGCYFDEQDDALTKSWTGLTNDWLWLNPPFARNAEFAAKCHAESLKGAPILFLTPASVDSNWFADHVAPYAHSLWLGSRIQFVGAKDGYPKPLMLSVYRYGLTGNSRWRWK